jgi:hypothetical protein
LRRSGAAYMGSRRTERISIARCRELLGPSAAKRSDFEVLEIRDRLYGLALSLVTVYRSASGTSVTFEQLTDDERVEVAERAAILESDAGLARDQAERLALSMYNSRVSEAN